MPRRIPDGNIWAACWRRLTDWGCVAGGLDKKCLDVDSLVARTGCQTVAMSASPYYAFIPHHRRPSSTSGCSGTMPKAAGQFNVLGRKEAVDQPTRPYSTHPQSPKMPVGSSYPISSGSLMAILPELARQIAMA